MKLNISIMVYIISLLPLIVSGQSNFQKGLIVMLNGDKIEDSVKLSNGKLKALKLRKTFAPNELKAFTIATTNYLSYQNDYYKEVTSGVRITLYQKVTDNLDEEVFNGTEFVGFAETTEGKIGDYYIRQTSKAKLDHITKKNFSNYFLDLIASNDSIAIRIKSGGLGYQQIRDVADLYNNK